MNTEEQVCIIWAVTNGFLDEIEIEKISQFEENFMKFLSDKKRGLLTTIKEQKELKPETIETLRKALEEFKKTWN